MACIRLAGLLALAAWALSTPGFLTPLSVISLITTVSLIGCVAVGMTFITLTGNVMSLCLGVTVSCAALVFLATLGLGVAVAFVLALAFGIVVTAAQGVLVGLFRANPILVSIAALALIIGISEFVTHGQRVYPARARLRPLQGQDRGHTGRGGRLPGHGRCRPAYPVLDADRARDAHGRQQFPRR